MLASRNRVSVLRPGSLQPRPCDEQELGFVYGPDAANADVHARSVAPLLAKLLEGYNAAVLLFGAAGSGRSSTLEGGQQQQRVAGGSSGAGGGAGGAGAENAGGGGGSGGNGGSGGGDGIVHLAADALFALLREKSAAVADAVARRRRAPSARAFDFFVEASFVELRDEEARDLLATGAGAEAALPVRDGGCV